MEDVELSGTTCALALQSDEYGQGPVSRPAHAIANAAESLSTVPVIGPYALATSYGMRALGKIASIFGFTNTPVVDNYSPMAPMTAPALASSEVGFPIEKLALDPKTELSIDPRIAGCDPEDPLVISKFVQRESYLL